jgi:hypothetical protein
MKTGVLHTGRRVYYGCNPTPRNRLLMARYVGRRLRALPPPPTNIDNIAGVTNLDMYFNDQEGDCVSAEEFNFKRIITVSTGAPQLNIDEGTAAAWINSHGFANGADLDQVMDAMNADGILGPDGQLHYDGPHGGIDWTNQTEVQLGLQYFKGLKIGVAAQQYLDVVGNKDGWVLSGASRDQDIDHCIGWYGCGEAGYWSETLEVKFNIPDNVFGLLGATWATVGFIEWDSAQATTGEAWARDTDPDRGDAAMWNAVAAGDFTEITGQPLPAS